MGKGGVGKTTVAAALAVALADRGHPVHLSTTDPAAHLQTTLPESVPGLTVSRIDPTEAITAYRDHVMTTKGKDVSEAERAALAEDLRHRATTRSRSSTVSHGSSAMLAAGSSSSTRPRPGTPCSCWTPRAPTTATSSACSGPRRPATARR